MINQIKNIIILQTIKKVYFGQASASDFTIHKLEDEARKQRYINRYKITKCGLNQVLILPDFGVYGYYGIYQPLKIVIMSLKEDKYIILI